MKRMIFLVLLIRFCHCEIIDDAFIPLYREEYLPSPIKIGGYNYQYVKIENNNFIFKPTSLEFNIFNLPYPMEYDFPKVIFPNIKLIKKLMDKRINSLPIQVLTSLLEKTINGLTSNKLFTSFSADFALSIHPSDPFDLQVIFAWNSNVTIMILNFPKDLCPFDINLGKGIDKYNISRDFSETNRIPGRQIYEVSTSRMIRIGCQRYQENEKNRNNLEISMNRYSFSGLGDEEIVLQGPCINEAIDIPPVQLKIKNSENREVGAIKMSPNLLLNIFYITTPMLWYPGTYEFTFNFRNLDFISKVEIYTPEYTFENYRIQWNESDRMNSPNFNLNSITLLLPSFVSNYRNATFFVVNLNKEPLLISRKLITITDKDEKTYLKIDVKELMTRKIDSSQQVGIFSVVGTENKVEWTRPFGLLWLKYYNNAINVDDCLIHLSKPIKQKTYICPENANMAAGLLSTFRKVDFQIDLVQDNEDKYICYAQILQDLDSKGVTCCYFIESKYLVYGQDFQLRNNSYFGSYTWNISPFQRPLNHFLNDRIPILKCCVLIKNDSLCTNYWDKFHNIMISKSDADHRASLFGDPHFIPYKSSSNFSFLGLGQYNLILTTDNKFTLQGRFHYIKDEGKSSLLKAIVFHFLDDNIFVTPSGNNITNLKWKILLNNITVQIVSLPFQYKNLFIFQNNDSTRLHIFIYFPENFNIYIELERFQYQFGLLEYMNMMISLSNNFENIITGGLFGKIDKIEGSTALYKEKSLEPLPMSALKNYEEIFEFVITWRLTEKYPQLFFDMEYTVPNDIYSPHSFTLLPECENNIQCSIDRKLFGKDNIFISTLAAVNSRLKLDNEWKSSLSMGFVCDHPPWKFIKLNSTSFKEFETIQILSCLNSSLIMSNNSQELTCKKNSNGKLEWDPNPPFKGEFCSVLFSNHTTEKSKIDSFDPIIVLGFIFIIIILIVIFLVIFKRKSCRVNQINDTNDTKEIMATTFDLNIICDNIIRSNENYDSSSFAQNEKTNKSQDL